MGAHLGFFFFFTLILLPRLDSLCFDELFSGTLAMASGAGPDWGASDWSFARQSRELPQCGGLEMREPGHTV